MDPLAHCVSSRYRVATRPIPIDKWEVAKFVAKELVPDILRWLQRQSEDDPIGAVQGIASGVIEIESSDGKETLRAYVYVESKAARGKWAAVLGGSAGKRKWEGGEARVQVILWLNGALSPKEWFDENPVTGGRLQPYPGCSSERCLAYGLYSILTHELTHAAESMFEGREPTYYQRGPGGEQAVTDETAYINDPKEIRAFMQQIVDEALRYATTPMIRDNAKDAKHLIDLALKLSTTWKAIDPHLTRANRARILKAVYEALNREGLV